jgi:hypothetical protein
LPSLALVAAVTNEDTSWLSRLPGASSVHICTKPGFAVPGADASCFSAANIGYEASSYLSYIVSHYDALPKRVAFLQGNATSWHRRAEVLSAALADASSGVGYLGLGRHLGFWNYTHWHSFDPGHPDINGFWAAHVAPWAGAIPCTAFNATCCGEFVASRDALRRLPRAAYSAWLNLSQSVDPAQPDGKMTARRFEYIWHMLLGANTC